MRLHRGLEENFGGDVEAAAEAARGLFEGWKVERLKVGEAFCRLEGPANASEMQKPQLRA